MDSLRHCDPANADDSHAAADNYLAITGTSLTGNGRNHGIASHVIAIHIPINYVDTARSYSVTSVCGVVVLLQRYVT